MTVPRPRAREHRERRAGVRLRSGCARPLERARGERGGEPRRSGAPRRARVLLARRPRRVELRVHRPDSAGARSRLECLGHRARARRRLRRDRTHPGRGGAAGTRCRARRAPRQSRGRAGGRRLSDVGGADRARRGAPASRSRRPRPCRIRLHRGQRALRSPNTCCTATRRTRRHALQCSAWRSRPARPSSSPRRSTIACTSRTALSNAPLLAQVRADLPDGALGATISGSGPTVIVWARDDAVDACVAELASRFPDVDVLSLPASPKGAHAL